MSTTRNLSDLIPNAPQIEVAGIAHDSRKVAQGFVFFAIKGAHFDGHEHIASAIANGAVAVVGEKDLSLNVPYFRSQNIRHDLAIAAAKFYPTQLKKVVAVTGTNGKTSTADFTRQVWELRGAQAASVGTLGLVHGGKIESFGADNTSPDPLVLHEKIAGLQGSLVIEASSIGLEQRRLDGLEISAAAFTNFTQDHLDYHGSMEQYFGCKALLFSEVMKNGVAVLNKNIPEYTTLEKICAKHQTVSFGKNADLELLRATPHASGQEIELSLFGKKSVHDIKLIGGFQIENILASLGLTQIYDADLASLKPVEGRMQFAAAGVYVDYAHTPDALENALKSLRPHCEGKLIVVFGCGGDRDKGKRPQMGKIAADLADLVFVTDDNPRTENGDEIRAQIMAACPDATEIADRKKAIAAALNVQGKSDIVLIAGKGHEKYQIIGQEKHYFDDIAVVKELTN
jgi:UDP-N-acetylmuramoyl-L-alanyl-D-glutamate--2,6-diaminopimelate ligase